MPETPQQLARQKIDGQLIAAGWAVQDYKQFNPAAGRGIALREAPLKPAQEKPWMQKLWIYDLRTNLHFTLKDNTLKRSDLDDFVACYFGNVGRDALPRVPNKEAAQQRRPTGNRMNRVEERFKSFTCDELTKRDKVNLDIFWLKDDALEESANLPAPEIIAADLTADLEAALEQFATIAEDLKK